MSRRTRKIKWYFIKLWRALLNKTEKPDIIDVSNFDTYILEKLYYWLPLFKEKAFGYPACLEEDERDKIIDEMIELTNKLYNSWESYYENDDEVYEQFKKESEDEERLGELLWKYLFYLYI